MIFSRSCHLSLHGLFIVLATIATSSSALATNFDHPDDYPHVEDSATVPNFEYCGPHTRQMRQWPPDRQDCEYRPAVAAQRVSRLPMVQIRAGGQAARPANCTRANPLRCYLMHDEVSIGFQECISEQRRLSGELGRRHSETIIGGATPLRTNCPGGARNVPSNMERVSEFARDLYHSVDEQARERYRRERQAEYAAQVQRDLATRFERPQGYEQQRFGRGIMNSFASIGGQHPNGDRRVGRPLGMCLDGFEQTIDRVFEGAFFGEPQPYQERDPRTGIYVNRNGPAISVDLANRMGAISTDRVTNHLRSRLAQIDPRETSAHRMFTGELLEEFGFQNLIRPPTRHVQAGSTANPYAGQRTCYTRRGRRVCKTFAQQGIDCRLTEDQVREQRRIIASAPAGAILVYTGGNRGHGHVEVKTDDGRYCSDGCSDGPQAQRCLVGVFAPFREVDNICGN